MEHTIDCVCAVKILIDSYYNYIDLNIPLLLYNLESEQSLQQKEMSIDFQVSHTVIFWQEEVFFLSDQVPFCNQVTLIKLHVHDGSRIYLIE